MHESLNMDQIRSIMDGFNLLEHASFLDRAALVGNDGEVILKDGSTPWDPLHLCTTLQVEEAKCILRLIPIWLTTILYSAIFAHMASLFIKQGDIMDTTVVGFKIPLAGMSAFDILIVVVFILFYRRLLTHLMSRLKKDRAHHRDHAMVVAGPC